MRYCLLLTSRVLTLGARAGSVSTGQNLRRNIKLLSGTPDTLTTDTVPKMTTSSHYNGNCNTQVTAQDNLMDDLISSYAIMTKFIVVLESVGREYF